MWGGGGGSVNSNILVEPNQVEVGQNIRLANAISSNFTCFYKSVGILTELTPSGTRNSVTSFWSLQTCKEEFPVLKYNHVKIRTASLFKAFKYHTRYLNNFHN